MSSFFTDDTSADAVAGDAEGETSVPETSAGADGLSGSASALSVNIVVIDPDDHARNRLVELLGNDVSSFPLVEDLIPYLNGEPIVMVLGPSCAVDGSLSSVERVIQAHREIGAILVAEERTTNLLQQALRSGVKDVLASPTDANQLQEAIGRVTSSQASSPTSGKPA